VKKSEAFPSRYLKCDDLNDKPITVTIESVTFEELTTPDGKKQNKVILHFAGAKKILPLNVTNFDSVVDITLEDDTDRWPGTKIELYPSEAQIGSKMVACVRIRAPEQGELPTKKPAKKPAPAKATAGDDMDDVIPF